MSSRYDHKNAMNNELSPADAAAAPAALEETKPEPEKVNILCNFQDGTQLSFTMKKDMPLGRLFSVVIQRYGPGWRFLFDGERIGRDRTPRDMDMEDGDCIDVMKEQIGGSQ